MGLRFNILDCVLLLMDVQFRVKCDLRSDLLPNFLSAPLALLQPFIAWMFQSRAWLATASQNSAFCFDHVLLSRYPTSESPLSETFGPSAYFPPLTVRGPAAPPLGEAFLDLGTHGSY